MPEEKAPEQTSKPARRVSPPAATACDPVPAAEEWERITPAAPAEIRPAVGRIRGEFGRGVQKCRAVTNEMCYSTLHPGAIDREMLQPWQVSFSHYRQWFSDSTNTQFNFALTSGTAPSIFNAYFGFFREGVKAVSAGGFSELLKMGREHAASIEGHPVEWAKEHISMLIEEQGYRAREWIRTACDRGNFSDHATYPPSVEEWGQWEQWRAPKFIHMKPMGNTPYTAGTAWERESESRSRSLVESLGKRFLLLAKSDLDKIAGDAYVQLAQAPAEPVNQITRPADGTSAHSASAKTQPDAGAGTIRKTSTAHSEMAKVASIEADAPDLAPGPDLPASSPAPEPVLGFRTANGRRDTQEGESQERAGKGGRPRKDDLRERVKELRAQKYSWARLTRTLNSETEENKTVGAYRNLVQEKQKK